MSTQSYAKEDEKKDLHIAGDATPSGSVESADSSMGAFDEARTKTLLRKLDWNLVPFLSLLYLLSFLDRTNIGNARLVGLEDDLGMDKTTLQYNIALAVFFPWYVAAEIPSNLMMKKTRPSLWITIIMLAWGVVMTLMGLVTNYTGLLIARMALGVAEGGLFPGVTFYITMWYRRHECGFRMALFFSAATAAGAFGGLLARGISEMDGVGGKPGWAWIFILEGLLTIVVAFFAYWVINDYPATANFLTAEEKVEVERRLHQDRNGLADEYDIKYLKVALKDWKIWVHMFITIGIYTPLYSFSLFLPTIVANMGYSSNTAQLMTVPPYVAACICTIAGGWLADRSRQRGKYMIFFCCLSIVGFVMLISTTKPAVQYLGTFLAACGIYPNVPMGVAWNGNNIGGSTKRGVGIAMHVGFGNLGGVISGFTYRAIDKPKYIPGHGTLIGTTTMSLLLCCFMTWYLRKENARRDAYAAETGVQPEDYTHEMREAEREKGDDATFFRYTV
ncbi:MFS general substrate transporter [Ascobolus immersus RN42]|uniref:MFS general substrate transporter n=1 Tax=Ascobolus immersus RN42 TaxID=1160509 RepID=A0A3N4IMM7_ASCIM|nr:MFS general substrate transporter [Ascobolus immersus RN42]